MAGNLTFLGLQERDVSLALLLAVSQPLSLTSPQYLICSPSSTHTLFFGKLHSCPHVLQSVLVSSSECRWKLALTQVGQALRLRPTGGVTSPQLSTAVFLLLPPIPREVSMPAHASTTMAPRMGLDC